LMKQLEEMKQAAMLDHLTSLPNRRYCDIALSAKLSELKRYNWMFGLVMADIDFFKRVNDTHGHHIGDRVLKSVSRALVENSRPFDVVSRWGGEEFLIVIPHVDADSLRNLTDRFRVIVEQTPIPTENGEVKVTISLGATLAQPSDTIQSLIERVDRLMYQSKDEGRNTSTFRSS